MYGLMRVLAKPISTEKANKLIEAELTRILNSGNVEEVILFGSAARSEMTKYTSGAHSPRSSPRAGEAFMFMSMEMELL